MLKNLSQFQPEMMLTIYDNLEFFIRLVVATAAGSLIGLERSRRLKEAGIRTHCIVALSAALFMILSKYAFIDMAELNLNKTDNARIAAQVVSGISFLGAGIIFKQGKSGVKGLTTAAGIWATSAVGLAFGAGMYFVGFVSTGIMMVLQYALHRHPAGSNPQYEHDFFIRMKDTPELFEALEKMIEDKESYIETSRVKKDQDMVEVSMFLRSYKPYQHKDVIKFMEDHPDVEEMSI